LSDREKNDAFQIVFIWSKRDDITPHCNIK